MANAQDIRAAAVAALQGLSGAGWALPSGRCAQGYLPVLRATGSGFWQSCTSTGSGAFAHIGPGALVGRGGYRRHPVLGVAVDVYLAIPHDTSNTLSGAVAFVETLRHALDSGTRGGTTYDAPDIRLAGPVALMHYRLSCDAFGCDPPIERPLRNETELLIKNETELQIYGTW